jgi:hypothetical protein
MIRQATIILHSMTDNNIIKGDYYYAYNNLYTSSDVLVI